jgi:putative hydrolase of HD superfamily
MITKSLIELLYGAASIQRWNDHIRPGKGFTELDKQAHKMIVAYVLARYEESDRDVNIDWKLLIEGCIYEYLHRIVLTDIKPPIYHRLMEKSGEKLNRWVLEQLDDAVKPLKGGFAANFMSYLLDKEYSKTEKKLLKAAHYLATNWEFKIIYNMNSNFYGLEDTKKEIENELEEHYDLAGVQKLDLGRKTSNFIDLAGQLRFQQRWTQSPRLPETSVMGHMLIVAILSYLFSCEIDACDMRLINNFLAGLFHDLPEVLTRDIVSPVKKSVEGLEEIIKEIEDEQLDEKLFPLLPKSWHSQMRYLMQDEFKSRIIFEGAARFVSSEEISYKYNENVYMPVDGELIRACDHLAAYLEAYLSISHGVTSKGLKDGYNSLFESYKNKCISGIDFSKFFGYFYPNGS